MKNSYGAAEEINQLTPRTTLLGPERDPLNFELKAFMNEYVTCVIINFALNKRFLLLLLSCISWINVPTVIAQSCKTASLGGCKTLYKPAKLICGQFTQHMDGSGHFFKCFMHFQAALLPSLSHINMFIHTVFLWGSTVSLVSYLVMKKPFHLI